MEDSKKIEIKKWVDTWEKASFSLRKVKSDELSANDYYIKNQLLLNEMLRYAFEHKVIRLSSGLVEQQQIFMRFPRKIL